MFMNVSSGVMCVYLDMHTDNLKKVKCRVSLPINQIITDIKHKQFNEK